MKLVLRNCGIVSPESFADYRMQGYSWSPAYAAYVSVTSSQLMESP